VRSAPFQRLCTYIVLIAYSASSRSRKHLYKHTNTSNIPLVDCKSLPFTFGEGCGYLLENQTTDSVALASFNMMENLFDRRLRLKMSSTESIRLGRI